MLADNDCLNPFDVSSIFLSGAILMLMERYDLEKLSYFIPACDYLILLSLILNNPSHLERTLFVNHFEASEDEV